METIEIIKDESGKPEFAKVPYEDWQDMQDAIEAGRIIDLIERGEMETFPARVVDALLDDENPVKVFRKHREMTQFDLAKAVGVTQAFISGIEKGKDCSIDVIKKIATALDVEIQDLV